MTKNKIQLNCQVKRYYQTEPKKKKNPSTHDLQKIYLKHKDTHRKVESKRRKTDLSRKYESKERRSYINVRQSRFKTNVIY